MFFLSKIAGVDELQNLMSLETKRDYKTVARDPKRYAPKFLSSVL